MSKIRPWEIFASLPILIPVGIIAVQRNLIFDDEEYGLLESDVLVLFLWLLIGSAIVVATKPWKRVSVAGSPLRWLALIGGCLATACMIFWATGWGRYRTVKFETLTYNFGITSYDQGLRTDLTLELIDPLVGPHMSRDVALLKHVVEVSGTKLAERPRSARVALAALLAQGLTWEEVLALPNGTNLALGGLLAEADPKPWHRLEWVPRPKRGPSPLLGFRAGVLSPEMGRQVVALSLKDVEAADPKSLERLVVTMMSFPKLWEEEQRERVLGLWSRAFADLEELAVEGLVMRQQLKELLGGRFSVAVCLKMVGQPSGSVYRHVPETLPRMVLGLVHSCGVITTEAPADQADLVITVKTRDIAHHSYSRPTYDYETYYEYRSTGRSLSGLSSRRVRKERQVMSGYEEATVWVPVASVEIQSGKETLKFPESLLHWHNLRYDYENKRFLDLDKEAVFGRMWPLGIHENHYVFGYMTDVY